MPPAGDDPIAAPGARPHPARRVHLLSTIVGVVGALVVASLVWLTAVVNSHTQSRLLRTQTGAAGVVLGEVASTIRTPLDTAVAVAGASGGNVADVERYVAPEVGAEPGRLFTSFSLWRLSGGTPVQLLTIGRPPSAPIDPANVDALASRIPTPDVLSVIDLLTKSPPHIGYVVESVGARPRYVALAESAVPAGRRAVIPVSSAFHDLDFAIYLGHRRVPSHLLEATTPPPTGSPSATLRIPFGTTSLDVVASARHPLGGGELPALPWIVGAIGAAIVVAAVVVAEWLMRRRRIAEHLARENLRLYSEQRSISQTLQNALLPKHLPDVPGVALAARYVPGDSTADVGGDWYDVIRCDNRSFIFAIGDVSGRGVPAANTMASLHYAIRAYAAQGDDTQTILQKLTALLDVGRDGHFATVLLGHVDVPDHRMTLVNAGHLPPLVVRGAGTYFIETPPAAPIGVMASVRYVPYTFDIPPGSSVLAYTDGLVERRGEILDAGLERLRSAAAAEHGGPEQLLDRVVTSLAADVATDDVALLAIRWDEEAHVAGAARARSFRAEPASVATARGFATETISSVHPELSDAVNLVVSEIATNAVQHGGTSFEVRVETSASGVRVEVSDTGPGWPEATVATPTDEGGRGLRIVEAVADGWGVVADGTGEGKTVWFELRAEGGTAEGRSAPAAS